MNSSHDQSVNQGSSTLYTPPYPVPPPLFSEIRSWDILDSGKWWSLASRRLRRPKIFTILLVFRGKILQKTVEIAKFFGACGAKWYLIQRILRRRRRRENFEHLRCYRRGKCAEGARIFCCFRAHTRCRNVQKWPNSEKISPSPEHPPLFSPDFEGKGGVYWVELPWLTCFATN